jgi:hypothetical protein
MITGIWEFLWNQVTHLRRLMLNHGVIPGFVGILRAHIAQVRVVGLVSLEHGLGVILVVGTIVRLLHFQQTQFGQRNILQPFYEEGVLARLNEESEDHEHHRGAAGGAHRDAWGLHVTRILEHCQVRLHGLQTKFQLL